MYLEDYIINQNENIQYAHWKLYKNNSLLVVVDESGNVIGVVTFSDIKRTFYENFSNVGDVCNKKPHLVKDGELTIDKARSMFIDFPNINHVPVVDENMQLTDIISRQQAFWMMLFKNEKLPKMSYAYCIWNAALEAKALNKKSISVIEFGVAGGTGLRYMEFHAKEITRLLSIDIEVYGFDLGEGLPNSDMGYKDMVNIWPSGAFKMNFSELQKRLEFAKLIIGDINETAVNFIENYSPACIGAIMVDVDYYSSTVPILKLLEKENQHFLPRVQMYFDDIIPEYEFQGECLAIKEFNRRDNDMYISPEMPVYSGYKRRTKICHKYKHSDYNKTTGIMHANNMGKDGYNLYLDISI